MKIDNRTLLLILLCVVVVAAFTMIDEQNKQIENLNAKVDKLDGKTNQGLLASRVALQQTEAVVQSLPQFKSLCKKPIGFEYSKKDQA